MTAAWPRAARLDAPHVLSRIAEITGVRLTLEGPAPGGEIGAAYVRWPDGRQSVLTLGRARTGHLVDLARAAGVPTAKQELSAYVDGVHAVVQQRLPGTPPSTIDADLVAAMVAINDKLAGILAEQSNPRPVDLYLTGDGPGFCLHGPLADYNARTAKLLTWVESVGTVFPLMIGDDLVHLDFQPGNVLVADGRLTGVIDWDGAARGDRHFDLITLRFMLLGRAPELLSPIDSRLASISLERRKAYWAHMSLRQVDWSIRHHDAATVEHWLTIAESGIPAD